MPRHPPLTDPVFIVDGQPVTYGDLVLVPMITGQWGAFVARCFEHAKPPAVHDEVAAGRWKEQFRRSQHLEAVADLDRWLECRHLDRDMWGNYAAWHVATGSPGPNLPVTLPEDRTFDHPPAAWWAEAVLSGDATDWVASLHAWVVTATILDPPASESPVACAHDGLWSPTSHLLETPGGSNSADVNAILGTAIGQGPPGMEEAADIERIVRLMRYRRRYREWLDRLDMDPWIALRIHQNRLLWTRLAFDECALESESTARELALCVNEDSEDLHLAAVRARATVRHHEVRRMELSDPVATALAGLRPGEASAPIYDRDGYRIYVLCARVAPDDTDPQVRAMAVTQEAADRINAASAGRIEIKGEW